MKKLIISLLIGFLLLFNVSFANNFMYNGNIPQKTQNIYKIQINKIFDDLLNKLSNKTQKQQEDILISIKTKINKIQEEKRLSENNKFLLNYLVYLIDEKIINLDIDEIDLKDILSIENNDKNIYVKAPNGVIINEEKNTLKCNEGFSNIDGNCIKKEISNNIIINNQVTTRKCYINNGEGQETFQNNSWSNCEIILCNSNYHKEGNSCLSNQQSCIIENGNGYKTWNGSWSSCNINSCNNGYENKDGKCLKTCNSNEHRDGNLCIANKIACDIENGSGEKEWLNGKWSYCRTVSCNEGYYNSENHLCEIPNIKIIIKNSNNIINTSNYQNIANVSINSNIFIKSSNDMCFIDKNNNNLESKIIINNNNFYTYSKNGEICIRNSYLNRTTTGVNFELHISNEYPINNEDIGKIIKLSLIKDNFQIESLSNYEKIDYIYSEE